MRRLCLSNGSFESYDYTDAKTIKVKSRQPRWHSRAHFNFVQRNREKSKMMTSERNPCI